jgi:hypothetical protein
MAGIWFDAKLVVSLSPERFSMSRLRLGGVALLLFASSLAFSPSRPASAALTSNEFPPGSVQEISETGKVVTYLGADGGLRHRDLASGTDIAPGATLVRGDGKFWVTTEFKKDGQSSDKIILDTATTPPTREVFDFVDFLTGPQAGYQLYDVADLSANGNVLLFRIGKLTDGGTDTRLWSWNIVTNAKIELDSGILPPARKATGNGAASGTQKAHISADGTKAVFNYANYSPSCTNVSTVKDPSDCLYQPWWTATNASDRGRVNLSPNGFPTETYVNDVAISGDGKVVAFQGFGFNVVNDADVLYHNRVYIRDLVSNTTSVIVDRGAEKEPAFDIDLDTTGDRVSYFDFATTNGSQTKVFQPVVKVRSTGAIVDGSFPAGGTAVAPAKFMSMSQNGEWLVYSTATTSYISKLDAGRVRRILAGNFIEVPVGGVKGVPGDAASAVLNVTAVATADAGYLTVWPCGSRQPDTSNLNYQAGEAVPNLVISKLGTDGRVCVFSSAEVDLFVDVSGYFPAGSPFTGIVPDRRLDTRPTKLAAGGETSALVTGATKAGATIPANASAVVVNITATGENSDGFITVWPCGTARPDASILNFQRGVDRANLSLAKVGADGKICLYSDTPTNLIVDVMGYFTGESTFTPQTPSRVLDTRGTASVTAGGRAEVTLPAGSKAVALNVASVSAAADGYATVWPCDEEQPTASNLNYSAGGAVANAVVVKVGASNKVCIFSDKASKYLVDLSGSFPGGSSFVPVSPARIFDTR